jgi:hypothetical protein
MTSEQAKTVADFLIADFEHEMKTTLRVLEAVPADHLDYRPDATSSTGLGLIRHIPTLDAWLLNSIADGTFAGHRRSRRLAASSRRKTQLPVIGKKCPQRLSVCAGYPRSKWPALSTFLA